MNDRQICGACSYHKRDRASISKTDYYCDNENSEYYGYSTMYEDTCEDYCESRWGMEERLHGVTVYTRDTDPDFVNVVRCKDCKYWYQAICLKRNGGDGDNWYCADGERK